jgi:hypothetical protein
VNALEQVAFGWQCLLGAVRGCRASAIWAPWAGLFALHAAGVLTSWWGAHPLLSWFIAPMLRAVEGEGALRYPELFRRLPDLARDAGLVTGALVLPVLAGVSTRLFARRYRGEALAPRTAWGEGLARAGALLVAALPVTLVAIGLQGMLQALPQVRLSGVARALAHPAADAALLFVRVACAYSAALVVLGGRSGPRALLAIPSTWAAGFVPAAVAILVLVPVGLLASAGVSASLAFVDRGAPEAVALAVLARAAVGAMLAMLASGAVTLAWLGAVEAREEPA